MLIALIEKHGGWLDPGSAGYARQTEIARKMMAGEIDPHIEPNDFSGHTVAEQLLWGGAARFAMTSCAWRWNVSTGRRTTRAGSACFSGQRGTTPIRTSFVSLVCHSRLMLAGVFPILCERPVYATRAFGHCSSALGRPSKHEGLQPTRRVAQGPSSGRMILLFSGPCLIVPEGT
jgi:hypothetical protein